MNKPKTFIRILILIFGIILPLLTLGIELTTAMCASVFFRSHSNVHTCAISGSRTSCELVDLGCSGAR
jgi:hypothetical protein